MEVLGRFNRQRIGEDKPPLAVGIGIHTGPARRRLRRQLEGALVHGHRRHGEHERAPVRDRASGSDRRQRGHARAPRRPLRARRARGAVTEGQGEAAAQFQRPAREAERSFTGGDSDRARATFGASRMVGAVAIVLPFEKPVVDARFARARAARARTERPRARAGAEAPRRKGIAPRARALRRPHAVAKGPAFAAPEPPVHARLRRPPLRRLHRAPRRPPLRRRRSHRRGPRALPRSLRRASSATRRAAARRRT